MWALCGPCGLSCPLHPGTHSEALSPLFPLLSSPLFHLILSFSCFARISSLTSVNLSHEQEAGRVKSGRMEGTHKITPLSDNQDAIPSAKSCSVEVGDCSDAGGGEDYCLSLDLGADLEKDVDLPVGNGGSGSGVKIEEALSESCSQNEPIEAARRNAPLPPVGRSRYHGVTRHRWSGKYEAHLWDNSCRIEGHKRKGRQVYLGSYNNEEKAARAYDLAALKFWGNKAKLNFPVTEYEKELEHVRDMSRDACVSYIRRRSSCFSRGTSAYRGVTKRQKDGRWQARIGLVCGSRDIYLGTFKSEEEAAEAYDVAAVKLRGTSAITNFDISNYIDMPPDGKE